MNVYIIYEKQKNAILMYIGRIDISEGNDVNKTSESEECNKCHYWYFLNNGCKFNHMYAIDAMIY